MITRLEIETAIKRVKIKEAISYVRTHMTPRVAIGLGLGSIVIISAAVAFAFGKGGKLPQLGSSQIRSTEDWQTYTNTIYEFSVKYPTDWSVVENSDKISFGPQGSAAISLNLLTHIGPADLQKLKAVPAGAQPVWKEYQNKSIKGKELNHTGCSSKNCREVLFQHDKTIFIFIDENKNPELDTVISTVTFTE
jgi:hypothetical protein